MMTLIRKEKVVVYARYDQNIFVLDFIKLKKAMTIDCKRLIYIVSNNK